MADPDHLPLDLSSGWRIDMVSTDPVAKTAAAELQAFLARIAGADLASEDAPLRFSLAHRNGDRDSFTWDVDANGGTPQVRLHGANARGLLYAVYDFLGELGCAWPGPGAQWERAPQGTAFAVRAACAEAPAFPGRCLILGHHAFLAEHADWLAWAARNRLNTLFVHTAETGLALGAAPISQWMEVRDDVKAELARYGMALELGGHGLTQLLPRDLFATMPDAFRMKGGVRTPDHNLDPTDPDGMAVVRKNARDWFQRHPDAQVYHLWPDDIPGGGWSESPACENLSPSDQALIATNALAQELEGVDPLAQVAHIAYHDTEEPPAASRPRANVCLLWAPRMRCYAQGAASPASDVNREHPRQLEEHVALFKDAGAKPPRVFEYYLDAILFKSVLPPLVNTMAEDAPTYRAAGVDTLQALMVGGRPWSAPPVNAYAFARLAWDTSATPAGIVADFANGLVGREAGTPLARHLSHLADAFAIALDFTPAEAKPAAAAGAQDFLDNPPTDMGDPWHADADTLALRLGMRDTIADHLAAATEALDEARRIAGPESDALMGQGYEFSLARLWFAFHFARLALYLAIRTGAPREEIEAKWSDANAICDEVDRWADDHVADPRYRDNTKLLHWLFWRLRLGQIRADHLLEGEARSAYNEERRTEMQARFARAATLWQ